MKNGQNCNEQLFGVHIRTLKMALELWRNSQNTKQSNCHQSLSSKILLIRFKCKKLTWISNFQKVFTEFIEINAGKLAIRSHTDKFRTIKHIKSWVDFQWRISILSIERMIYFVFVFPLEELTMEWSDENIFWCGYTKGLPHKYMIGACSNENWQKNFASHANLRFDRCESNDLISNHRARILLPGF